MKISERRKKQIEYITEIYHKANDYIADFEESEDRCATLEAENNRFRNTIKNMNENFREHLNALEAENEKLKEQVKGLHKECRCDTLATLEAENKKLKHDIEELKWRNDN